MNKVFKAILLAFAISFQASAMDLNFVFPEGYEEPITQTNGIMFGMIPYNTMVYQGRIGEIARQYYPLIAGSENMEQFTNHVTGFVFALRAENVIGEEGEVSVLSIGEAPVVLDEGSENARNPISLGRTAMESRDATNILIGILFFLVLIQFILITHRK